MFGKIRAFVALLSLVAAAANAHPHEWVDWGARLVLAPDASKIQDVVFEMTWDQSYSALVFMDFPKIAQRKLTPVDRSMIAQTYGIQSRGDANAYLHVLWNGKRLALKSIELTDAYETTGKATLEFTARLETPLPVQKGELRLTAYDATFYTDIGIRAKNPLTVVATPAPSYKPRFEQDKKNAYYGGQVYPEVIVVEF